MRVLLLNPLYTRPAGGGYEKYFIRSGSRWPHSGIKSAGAIPHYLPFPFSLAYAGTLLKNSSVDVQALDAVALNLRREPLLQRIKELKPQAVFYEFTTPTFNADLALAAQIKEQTGARIITAGAHAAYFAREIVSGPSPVVDFVVRGEYEYILPQLFQALEGKSPIPASGLVYMSGSKLIDTGCFLAQDQPLPEPLRDIFPANDRPLPILYRDGFCQLYPALQMQSSRGCRYQCSFCLNSGKNAAAYRQAPAESIARQIRDAVEKYRVREVYFDDDDFLQDAQHVENIFSILHKEGLSIKWSAMCGFTGLTPRRLERLAALGCIGLKLGLESASPKVLKAMQKPLELSLVRGIISSCRKQRIKTHVTFTIGFLDETWEDIRSTMAYAGRLDADTIQVSIATPLPGSAFFEEAKSRGLLTAADWEDYDAKRKSVVDPGGVYPKTLCRIRKDFLRGWFLRKALNPLWAAGHLPVILRTLKGLGPSLFCRQLAAVIIDENKNN